MDIWHHKHTYVQYMAYIHAYIRTHNTFHNSTLQLIASQFIAFRPATQTHTSQIPIHTYTQTRIHNSTAHFISYHSNPLRCIQSYIQCKHTNIQVEVCHISLHTDIHFTHTYISSHTYITYICHHTYIHTHEVHNITLRSVTILNHVPAYMRYIHTSHHITFPFILIRA